MILSMACRTWLRTKKQTKSSRCSSSLSVEARQDRIYWYVCNTFDAITITT
jgi:hypothetical protein